MDVDQQVTSNIMGEKGGAFSRNW